MTDVATPMRTCVGCRSVKDQASLVRYVRGGDGEPFASRTATGRGAWVCEARACFDKAVKTRAFDRAWKTRSSHRNRLTMAN